MRNQLQRGFTLIELIVVVAIIGVLIAIIAPTTKGSTDQAEAQKLEKLAGDILTSWKLINDSCGTPKTISNAVHPIVGGAAGSPNYLVATDLVFSGITAYDATTQANYAECYKQSGATPLLNSASVKKTATAGTYITSSDAASKVEMNSLASGASVKVFVNFYQVPLNVAKTIVSRRISNPDMNGLIDEGDILWQPSGPDKGILALGRAM